LEYVLQRVDTLRGEWEGRNIPSLERARSQ
jgi:hypothetical protein